MRFVDLKIRTKLMGAFGVLILIAFVMSVITVVILMQFKRDINSFTSEFLPQLELSARINNELQTIDLSMEGYYLTGKSEYFSKARAEFDSLKMAVNEGEQLLENSKKLTRLEQNLSETKILIPQYEQTMMMAFKVTQDIALLREKLKSGNAARMLQESNNTQKKKKKSTTAPAIKNVSTSVDYASELTAKTAELQTLYNKDSEIKAGLKKNAENLRKAVVAYTSEVAVNFNRSIRTSLITTILIVLFSLVIAVTTLIFISKMITVPLLKGIDYARSLANGDLTTEIVVDRKDEIGLLAENMQLMGKRFREVISYVSSTSINLSAASLELSSSSQFMSQGSSEQASSSEEVSAAIEEMTANILQNRDNANLTEKIAMKAEQDIYTGSARVAETVDAMHEIATKISIIGEIAFQTNILALNAAVEAARAGENGRGFGVVAEEVGKLADKSKQAALEIDQLTKTSVFNAEATGKLMTEIVPEIQKTSQLIQEISVANKEQSAGADQINLAIQQLNIVTQQNAATSEELSTNAVELAAQAEQLREIISFFKIGEAEHDFWQKSTVDKSVGSDELKPEPEKRGVIIELDDLDSTDDEFERF